MNLINREKKSFENEDPINKYIKLNSFRISPVQKKLYELTLMHPKYKMMGAPEILQLLQNLIRAIKAKNVLDIGVFTGCSTLAQALAIPEDGKVVACDIQEETVNLGKPFWEEAGVSNKIDLRIAPACETLDKLLSEGKAGSFDFAFIDADKERYPDYYEKVLQLLRPGGIITIDNVLQRGKVADTSVNDKSTLAVRALNEKIVNDDRVDVSMLRIGDGLTIVLKR